jgi:predicted transcriptional regulator
MNPYKQIDFVFFFLKERSELSADFGKENIRNHIKLTPEIKINTQIFEEILQRLLDDGYIKETIRPETQPTYHLTFNGRIFEGYFNKNNSLNEDREWLKNLQIQTLENSKKLNKLTWIIAGGTFFAAIYYIIEIVKNWFCI